MIAATVVSVLLAILVVTLLAFLNKRTREKEYLEKQEKRSWMLKIALEKTCHLPVVEAKELEKIEPQLDRMANELKNDADLEEKMRALIMSLYEAKMGTRDQAAPVKGALKNTTPPPNYPPITGRGFNG